MSRAASRNFDVVRIPNTETGTMDLEFKIDEGQQSYIEKIEIRGNVKTKDKVIRRELAVSPGEVFDMVRVKLSKRGWRGWSILSRVDTRPEPTTICPTVRTSSWTWRRRQRATSSLGAGFSSVDSLVGIVRIQRRATFNARGSAAAARSSGSSATVGTQRQDYELTFIEPWFLDRKLQFGIDLYYRYYSFLSPNDIYMNSRVEPRWALSGRWAATFSAGESATRCRMWALP